MSMNDDIVARAQALAIDLLSELEARLARVREAEVKLTEAQAELRERQTPDGLRRWEVRRHAV